jgi:tartrate dehydratase beta subunit/fumarate hydratase class I family protein
MAIARERKRAEIASLISPVPASHQEVDVLEYPELGMEAIWAIDVVDFPAFILVDDKGNDFYQQLN